VVDKEEIRKLLKQYFMTKASVFIRDNGTVYIGGAIDLKISKKVNQLPVKFDKIAGCFDCVNNRLTSLENSPEEIGGAFDCSGNRLTSLIGAPKRIEGDFTCWDNPLTSLAGIPEYVGNRIWISYSKNLPLLRLISVKCSGFVFDPPEKYSYSKKIESYEIITDNKINTFHFSNINL
jgi:hypothetical protein